MIREFSVDMTDAECERLRRELPFAQVIPAPRPGRKTFAFDDQALTAIAGDSFERFLWSSFDRVEEKGGSIILANDNGVTFFMPVEKLQDPAIRRAIFDFVSGRVGLNG